MGDYVRECYRRLWGHVDLVSRPIMVVTRIAGGYKYTHYPPLSPTPRRVYLLTFTVLIATIT